MLIIYFILLILYCLISLTSLMNVKLESKITLKYIMGSENDFIKTNLSTPSSISDQTLHLTTNNIFIFHVLNIKSFINYFNH